MGSQRTIAERLMEHFVLSEEDAYKLASHIGELTSLEDQVHDAAYILTSSACKDFKELCALRDRFTEVITSLEEKFRPLRPRRAHG